MNQPKPCFELTRVYEDGTSEPVGLVPVTQLNSDIRMGRRGFLGTAILLGTTTSIAGCSAWEAFKKWWNQMGSRYEGSQACGTAIPAGAVCSCNCVPGVGGGPMRCTCDQVCTCVPVGK